ncbi:MAG: winged helix-turn-helix domain-containing protein, partial [Gemmatimonadales bacterium]
NALSSHDYRLVEVGTMREALEQAAGRHPDVILLDLGLPDGDGLDATRQIREWSRTPIVVLSARGLESDKIAALDAGADDYLTKPFSVGELLARIRVALRHSGGRVAPTVFEVRGLRVDLERRIVEVGGAEVHLTPTEYRILAVLVAHAGKVLTHRQLIAEVWGAHVTGQTPALRVHMNQLRHKIEREPARPRLLITEPGVGYRLRDE